MPATDTSAVQITINVVDGNSGEVVSRVSKSLNSLGDAGAGSGKKVASGMNDAGEAGTRAGKNISKGMDEAGGHSLNALDNVRLVRDDLGIHIPRAMEKVISQSKLAMGAIGALGSGLIALGAAEVLYHLVEQAYQLYKTMGDVNSETIKYAQNAGRAAQGKLFDTASLETARKLVSDTSGEIDKLTKKRNEAGVREDNSGSLIQNLGYLYIKDFKRYNKDDDRKNAETSTQRDVANDRVRLLEQQAQIERLQAKAAADSTALVGAAARNAKQSNADAIAALQMAQKQTNEQYLYHESIEKRNQLQRAGIHREANLPSIYQPAMNAGREAYQQDVAKNALEAGAANTADQRKQLQETLHAQAEARNARLQGEAQYRAQVDEGERQLLEKYVTSELTKQSYIRQRAAMEDKYAADRAKRLREEQAETEQLRLQANTGGLTGLAKIDAQTQTRIAGIDKQAPTFSDPGTASARKGAVNQEALTEATQAQKQFTDRLTELDAARSDRFESESAKIAGSAQRTVAEITKAWTETYGQLGAMDARRVQSYGALQGEIQKINADTAEQQQKVRQRITDDTVKAERSGARGGGNPERERTQAIVNEYADRYAKLEELRANDAANADLYRRQEIAADQEKNNKLLDQQKQLRDKLAGELKGFFSNPLEALRSQGEEAASKIAASYLLKLRGPQAGTAPTGGGGALGSAMPHSWKDVGGLFHRQQGGALRPGPLTAAPAGAVAGAATVSAASSTLNASTATIHVQSATITGMGGGSSSSPLRPASYGGGSLADLSGTTGGGIAGSMVAADSSSSNGGFSGGGTTGGSGSGIPYAIAAPETGAGGVRSGGLVGLPQQAGGGPGAGASVTGTLNTLPGMGQNLNDLTKTLGMKDGIASKVPGLAGANSKLGAFATKYGGAIGGATSLFGAVEGGGGVGGALQGALGGAQLGAEFAGPAGAAVGALAGAVVGLIGFGARSKAETYDKHQVKPRIKDDLQAFESGTTDYQTVYDDMDTMSRDAKTATKAFGSGGLAYYNDTIKGEIQAAQARLTRENKAGRSSFGFTAAQFHEGGRISGFGSLATTGDQGFIHAQKDEFMVRQQPAMEHSAALQYINAGASHSDMASYYGGGGATSQAPANDGPDVHLHFHTPDPKSAHRFLMDNQHSIRAALNNSYAENSGGADFA